MSKLLLPPDSGRVPEAVIYFPYTLDEFYKLDESVVMDGLAGLLEMVTTNGLDKREWWWSCAVANVDVLLTTT